ncbi:hypothetical protein S245_040677 [Arachis hypogaea]|nr:uncharacterized protein DS421_12g373120 [Arachis hypogaea]
MELRSCGQLHFIQAINGGLVTKVLNITCGRPRLSFKDVKDIYDGFSFNHNAAKVERSCIDALEEVTVKSESDSSESSPNDDDDMLIINLVEDDSDNFTLNQIKQRCKTRKRKQKQSTDPAKGKIKVEASPLLDDHKKKQIAMDDSDFMETLGSWRSKQSKKAKKRNCIKDPISTSTQEIIPVVKAEDVLHDEVSPPVSGVSTALVEVKFEVPESDCMDRPDDYFCIVAKEGIEITDEWNLENQFNYDCKEHADLIPLRIEWPFNMDNVMSDSDLNNDQSPNFPAIEFKSAEGIIHPDPNCIPKLEASLVEDQNSDTSDYQPDGDSNTKVILRIEANNEGLDPLVPGSRDDNASPCDGCKDDESTAGAEVQAKPTSTSEHGLNPGESLVCVSDDSSQCEEKESFSLEHDDEKRYINDEATDELNSWEEHEDCSKVHRPERLLSTRKTISPTSQEKLCKAMESVHLIQKNNLMHSSCKGKLQYGEQTNKSDADEGLNDNMRPGFTDSPDKIIITPKTSKRGSQPKGIFKSPSRPANRIGFNSVQSCSKSAIAFSQQQMHNVECLTMKLTKELKSMKEIVDDMLRSEFCLNTSLRYKVNEARMAVKNATRAEEAAKRCLSFMARDCNRFCKIMKLSEGGPPAAQEVVRKERKKIAFADEAGGRLCEVKLFEDDVVSLPDSN